MSRSSSDPLEVPRQLGPLFAKHDPQTSREAAKRIAPHLGRAQALALKMVRAYPGRTCPELAVIRSTETGEGVEYCRQMIGRRLNELERAGLIRWEGEREGCRVWWPVEET